MDLRYDELAKVDNVEYTPGGICVDLFLAYLIRYATFCGTIV